MPTQIYEIVIVQKNGINLSPYLNYFFNIMNQRINDFMALVAEKNPNEPEFLQEELAMNGYDIIVAFIELTIGNIEDLEDFELENLPVGKVLHDVSVSSKYLIDDLLKFAANDLGRLKAAIETHLGSMKYASAALREVS